MLAKKNLHMSCASFDQTLQHRTAQNCWDAQTRILAGFILIQPYNFPTHTYNINQKKILTVLPKRAFESYLILSFSITMAPQTLGFSGCNTTIRTRPYRRLLAHHPTSFSPSKCPTTSQAWYMPFENSDHTKTPLKGQRNKDTNKSQKKSSKRQPCRQGGRKRHLRGAIDR